ncbi:MAG: nucleotidyltransferase domain-containing protein, partial [Candidatus Omnitrophica bacterium]|nr:nucleotidyltransferase domain-containing protein [Candidatus Omnitrophota bacterium]
MVNKSLDGLREPEKKALQELKSYIEKVYNGRLKDIRLFGSKARGDAQIDSDIDIFLVLDRIDWEAEKALYDFVFELDLKYEVVISLVLYSEDEYRRAEVQATP